MPHHEKHPKTEAVGEITHVFAHRFVLETGSKSLLADLTPRGLEIVSPRVGDRVAIEGEQKPSEIKVSRLKRDGETFEIGDGPHHAREDAPVDSALAIQARTNAGYEFIGAARRKPKHFVLEKKAPRLRSSTSNRTATFVRPSLYHLKIRSGDPRSREHASRKMLPTQTIRA